MRSELLQAASLVASLQLAGPLVAPAELAPGTIDRHLGQTVAVEGRVVDVRVDDGIHEVVLGAPGGRTRVLSRAPPPPVGALVRVVGDAAPGQSGPVLWTDGPWEVHRGPDRAPLSLQALLARAPERAGTSVAVRGTFDANGSDLVDGDRRLPVRVLGPQPPEAPILAWGMLHYVPDRAGYRLDATGWEPWSPSSG